MKDSTWAINIQKVRYMGLLQINMLTIDLYRWMITLSIYRDYMLILGIAILVFFPLLSNRLVIDAVAGFCTYAELLVLGKKGWMFFIQK